MPNPELSDRPRNLPLYTLTHAATFLRISPTTLRSWVVGYPYPGGSGRHFPQMIVPIDPERLQLSFENLVESHILRGMRTRSLIPMSAIRVALDQVENELQIDRALLSGSFHGVVGEAFLQRLEKQIGMSRSVQAAFKQLLWAHLQRIDRGAGGAPVRLYPVTVWGIGGPKIVAIDPLVANGRPSIVGKRVGTATIVERLDSRHTREIVAQEFGLEDFEIDEAILYERAS